LKRESEDGTIAVFQPRAATSRAAAAVAFFMLATLSLAGLAEGWFPPAAYQSFSARSYVTWMILLVWIAGFALWKVGTLAWIGFNAIRNKGVALALRGDALVAEHPLGLPIKVADIDGVALDPYEPLWGRPERVKVTLKDGSLRYLRCDVLAPRGEELVRALSSIADLADAH
jgi:hypothetical protein